MIDADINTMDNDDEDDGMAKKRGNEKKHRFFSLCYKRKAML